MAGLALQIRSGLCFDFWADRSGRWAVSSISFAAALLFSFSGCTKSAAELRQDDRVTLEQIVAEDVRASKAMADADTAARSGDVPTALAAVDNRAKPAIEAGLRLATSAEPKTEWGRTRRDTFATILADRRSELVPYREAVKSGDAAKLVAAIEAQAKIERRAIAAIADARDGR